MRRKGDSATEVRGRTESSGSGAGGYRGGREDGTTVGQEPQTHLTCPSLPVRKLRLQRSRDLPGAHCWCSGGERTYGLRRLTVLALPSQEQMGSFMLLASTSVPPRFLLLCVLPIPFSEGLCHRPRPLQCVGKAFALGRRFDSARRQGTLGGARPMPSCPH